jgi:hypothetical protein
MITTTPAFGFSPRPFKPVPVVRFKQLWVFDTPFGGSFENLSENDSGLMATDIEFPFRIVYLLVNSRFGGCNVSLRWNGNLVHFSGFGTIVAAPVGDPVQYNCSQSVPIGGELTLDVFDIDPLYDGFEIVEWQIGLFRPPF